MVKRKINISIRRGINASLLPQIFYGFAISRFYSKVLSWSIYQQLIQNYPSPLPYYGKVFAVNSQAKFAYSLNRDIQMEWNFKSFNLLIVISFFLFHSATASAEAVIIKGAGPSTKIVSAFFSAFQQHYPQYSNTEFITPPNSMKHAGGIRWSTKNLFGRTGRSLNSAELSQNKKEIILAKIPAVFVVGSDVKLKTISAHQLKLIYEKNITNWQVIGGSDAEITLVGREPTEAIHSQLKVLYPFMEKVKYWLTFTRDHQILGYITSKRGRHSLSYGAKPNFDEKTILNIKGKQTGVSVGLVYDEKNEKNKLLGDVRAFSKTKAWKKIVKDQGYLTAD